jgi:hypothetical protein
MRDRLLGAVAGAVHGAAIVPVLLFVFRRTLAFTIARLGQKRYDWAFVLSGSWAIVVANGALVLVVLLRPFTREWSAFLSTWAPCFVIGVVFDNWMRRRSLR